MTDPLARLRELLDEAREQEYKSEEPSSAIVTLIHVLQKVMEEIERPLSWRGHSMVIDDKVVDRHVVLAFKQGCVGQAEQVVGAIARGLEEPQGPPGHDDIAGFSARGLDEGSGA